MKRPLRNLFPNFGTYIFGRQKRNRNVLWAKSVVVVVQQKKERRNIIMSTGIGKSSPTQPTDIRRRRDRRHKLYSGTFSCFFWQSGGKCGCFLLLCSSVYRFIVVGSSGRAKAAVLRNCVQHMRYFGHCRAAEREGSRNQSFRFLSERIVQRVFFFFFRPYYFSLFFPLLFCLAVPFLSFQHRGEFLPKKTRFLRNLLII